MTKKLFRKRYVLFSVLIAIGTWCISMASQGPDQRLKKIQKYIDKATTDNLAGVLVYIKSPKYGEWIGTSGYSNIEEQIPLKKADIFSLASIGKTYTAAAILKLVEEGRLSLEDKIENYLPLEIIENIPNAKEVTVRHLLAHTSGFKNYNKDPELNRLYLTGQLKLDTFSHINALRRYGYGDSPYSKPVGTYSYSSTNYLLLTMIMDRIVPEGHEAYLRAFLHQYGYHQTFYKQTPPSKLVNHYGDLNQDGVKENLSDQTIETTNWYSGDDGIYAPIIEASHFLENLLKGKILKERTLKEMTTWNDEKNPDYGLGLMADKGFPYKFLIGHSGRGIGITTDLYYFPKQDMTIAIFCNTGLRAASPIYKKTYMKMRKRIMKKLFLF